VYNHTHLLWFLDKDFDGWQANVDRFAAQEEYDTILAGHGAPPTPVSGRNSARTPTPVAILFGDDGETYNETITKRFPTCRGALLIDIANDYLFGRQG
jgi:hypothetical protein